MTYYTPDQLSAEEQYGRKMKLLEVMRILERETDDEHRLTANQIAQKLIGRGFHKPDRKGIYNDINVLNYFHTPAEGKKPDFFVDKDPDDFGYYLTYRLLDVADLKLIIDAILSSKFLSEAKTKELIAAMETLCSRHQARALNHEVMLANRVKSMNDNVLRNVDYLNAAIMNDCQVSFKYFDYGMKMERLYYKSIVEVSPLFMVYADDNYYLISFNEKYKALRTYRIDRMTNVSFLPDKPRNGSELYTEDQKARYQQYTFGMYGGGETELVTLRVHMRAMNALIDKFGKNIFSRIIDDTHVEVKVSVVLSPQFYAWVFGLKNYITIVSEKARKGMVEHLAAVMKRYE